MAIPEELHVSIYHNGKTGKGIKELATACWKWYMEKYIEELKTNNTYETVDVWL